MVEVDPNFLSRSRPVGIKPKVDIPGFELAYYDRFGGIPEDEVAEFRTFLRDSARYIYDCIEASRYLWIKMQEEKQIDGKEADLMATPVVKLYHICSTGVQYYIWVTWDGAVSVDRQEMVHVTSENGAEKAYPELQLIHYVGDIHSVEDG
jgi:hypothetical protein